MVAVCSWSYLMVILALWFLLFYEADLWWPATLLMFSPRWLLTLPLGVLIIVAVVWRQRTLPLLLLTLALIVWPVMSFRVPWSSFSSDAPQGFRLRVLTCNMHYQKPDMTPLKRLLDETQTDLVALQEWRGWEHPQIFSESGWHVSARPELFLASRFPIRQATEVSRNSVSEKGAVARYEVQTPAGLVTVFSLHLASPREGLYEVIHDRARGIVDLEAGSDLRWGQCENLAQEAEEVSGPVLLMGDFNTPPESALFRRLWDRYTDAFDAAGWGWGYTFFGGRTAVRIDRILAGPGWRCDRCRVGPDVGSPHRPVLAELIWPASVKPDPNPAAAASQPNRD